MKSPFTSLTLPAVAALARQIPTQVKHYFSKERAVNGGSTRHIQVAFLTLAALTVSGAALGQGTTPPPIGNQSDRQSPPIQGGPGRFPHGPGFGNPDHAQWPMFGQNAANTASGFDRTLSSSTVSHLKPKWVFKTGGDVSARPAVVDGVAYFPDWATPKTSSNLWALNGQTGEVVWSRQLSDYGLPVPTHARTTPAVIGGVLYLGTQEGAWMLAIDARSGALLWKTQVETADAYAVISTSPTVIGGVVYTGVASTQEGVTTPGFVATARGSVVALDASSGRIQWKPTRSRRKVIRAAASGAATPL